MQSFECSWQELRPAPKITIDFKDGRVLERTLAGNIATWFVTPDGKAVDVVPGLVDATEYAWRVNAAADLLHELPASPNERLEAVRQHHAEPPFVTSLVDLLENPMARLAQVQAPAVEPIAPELMILSKGMIEDPIKAALRDANRSRRMLKGRVFGGVDPMKSLDLDTRFTRDFRDPVVRDRFRQADDLPTPGAWEHWLFAEVLDVHLNDPWLGLAPYVLGGDTGR